MSLSVSDLSLSLSFLCQVLQTRGAVYVFLCPYDGALVRVGRVDVGGVFRPGHPQIRAGVKRHVAGEQRCTHLGEPTV